MEELTTTMMIFDGDKLPEGAYVQAIFDKNNERKKVVKGMIVHLNLNYLEILYIDKSIDASNNNNKEKRIEIFADELWSQSDGGWIVEVLNR